MAVLKEVNMSLGISIDKNGLWVKPNLGLRVELDGEDAKPENRKTVIKRCFDILEEDLNEEIDRLMED